MTTDVTRLTCAALTLGLLLGGCKGADNASTSPPAPPGSPTAAPSTEADKTKAPTDEAPTDETQHAGPGDEPGGSSGQASEAPAGPRPSGIVNGQPFVPAAVILEQESSGQQTLHFYDQPSDALCSEPYPGRVKIMLGFIADRDKPFAAGGSYTKADGVGLYFSIGGASPPDEYEVKIDLAETDAVTNRLRGTIRFVGADGTKLEGEFAGDYCPTKAQVRTETTPIHGLDWTMDPVDADSLPEAPANGVLAGLPFAPVYVSILGAGDQTTIHFFAEKPGDPCASPARGRVVTRVGGVKVDEKQTGVRIDTFMVRLNDPSVLKPGGRVAARYDDAASSKLASASILFYEKDGNRAVLYSQYYSLALAIDAIDEAANTVKGRIYAAVKDSGMSMVVGGFSATRCPPQE